MTYIQYTDFKNHTKDYFDKIQGGEELIVIRRGKPIAKIIPFENKTRGWVREVGKITIKKGSPGISQILREERNQS